MNRDTMLMHRLLNFVYNKNLVDSIELIYENKVNTSLVSHLKDKAIKYVKDSESNTLSWIKFIGNLDNKNSEILINYILK